MFKGMNRATMAELIVANLPGPQEDPIPSREIEARTGIPSRKAAAIISSNLNLEKVETVRLKRTRSTSAQNYYRRKF